MKKDDDENKKPIRIQVFNNKDGTYTKKIYDDKDNLIHEETNLIHEETKDHNNVSKPLYNIRESNNNEDQSERLNRMMEGLKNLKKYPEYSEPKSADILGMIRNNKPERAAEYMQKLRDGVFDPKEFGQDYRQHPFYLRGLADGRKQAEECADLRFDEVFDHLINTIHLLRK